MKILSYNINDSKQWKVDKLFEIGADVYVVPEIACPEQTTLPNSYEMAWEGITWKFSDKDKWGSSEIWSDAL